MRVFFSLMVRKVSDCMKHVIFLVLLLFSSGCFSLEKNQEYEYIIAHFFDKNAEGALEFLHVLPGAWSAYRYKSLVKSEFYEPNLLQHSYFKMILNP